MRRLLLGILCALALTAGCLGLLDEDVEPAQLDEEINETTPITLVEERHQLNFTTDEDTYSSVLEPGAFAYTLPGANIDVMVDLPPTEGTGAATDRANMNMGLFMPEIPECDYEIPDTITVDGPHEIIGNDELPEACQVPVIATIGPYFSPTANTTFTEQNLAMEGDNPATWPANRLGGFLIENFVPHGYAVAQISVFGTGDSGHCMDLMGPSEQAGIDAALTWLGEQPFTNEEIAITGRSYDGTTPWQAAAMGNDYVATILPIVGLTGLHDLMWVNGTSEMRGGTGLLAGLYYSFGIDIAPDDVDQVLCPGSAQSIPQSWAAYVTGDQVAPEVNDYWTIRSGFLDRAVENWNGSVYYIHGMQDWNVNPHMAHPAYSILDDHGFETKGLFPQMAHNYPDRLWEHEQCDFNEERCAAPTSVRHDWAQDLLEWFDHYLKGIGEKPQQHVEIQDDEGFWRVEETYPPQDIEPLPMTLDEGDHDAMEPTLLAGGELLGVGAQERIDITFADVNDGNHTRVAGMPTLHVDVTPTGPGGQLFAELRDATRDEHLGHAVMDLRYHEGGDEMQTIVPGERITAKMQFFPLDVVLPAGHELELRLSVTGEDYMPPAINNPVEVHLDDESVLTLPTIERTPNAFFVPPGHENVLGDGVPPDADGDPDTAFE